jgi:hypothetical protein
MVQGGKSKLTMDTTIYNMIAINACIQGPLKNGYKSSVNYDKVGSMSPSESRQK